MKTRTEKFKKAFQRGSITEAVNEMRQFRKDFCDRNAHPEHLVSTAGGGYIAIGKDGERLQEHTGIWFGDKNYPVQGEVLEYYNEIMDSIENGDCPSEFGIVWQADLRYYETTADKFDGFYEHSGDGTNTYLLMTENYSEI